MDGGRVVQSKISGVEIGIGFAKEVPMEDPALFAIEFPSLSHEVPNYRIVASKNKQTLSCSCPDHTYRKRWCKHLKAFLEGRYHLDLKERDWVAHLTAIFKRKRAEEWDYLITWARQWLAHNATITADHFHRGFLGLEFADTRIYGMVLKRLEELGEVVRRGVVKSQRSECHYRGIVVFERTENLRGVEA